VYARQDAGIDEAIATILEENLRSVTVLDLPATARAVP
jgi:hypothetical protein